MHPIAGLAAAALGGLCGPLLAGLTVRVPDAGRLRPGVQRPGVQRPGVQRPGMRRPGMRRPGGWLRPGVRRLPVGWWRGAGAGPRRRVLLTGLAMLGCGLAGLGIGARAALPAYLCFGLAAAALTVIDMEHHRLPNRIVYPTYAAGLVLLGVAAVVDADGRAYLRGLVAMALLYGLFLLLALLSPRALGLGDVKLAGVLGMYLGYLGAGRLALGMAVGVALGAVAAIALLAARRAGWRSELAYGPALLAGSVVAVGVGQPMLDAYLGAAGLR
jgi:leader peptidase (prepilin peptidase)/N-methyltransferase